MAKSDKLLPNVGRKFGFCLFTRVRKNVEKFTKWKWIFGELNPRECMQVRNYFKT